MQNATIPQRIMGPLKTDIGSASLNPTHAQTVKTAKRPALQSNPTQSRKGKLKI